MNSLLLAPELFTTDSGIPRILRLYLKALCDLSSEKDRVRFVSLNDTSVDSADLRPYTTREALDQWRTCNRDKKQFVRDTLRLSSGVKLIVCGHVAQLPVAWLASWLRPGLRYALVAHGIEVWLDVVFNHTGEGEEIKPTLCLRGFDDARAYLHLPDGTYNDDSGTGNVSNPGDPNIRHLILTALERFADLGIDGFRFDLASLLTRDGGVLVEQITEWAAGRDVRLIAEPWDLGEYQLGKWAAPWLQWNDRFRDDVRGFVRGEPGRVGVVMQRVQGSPDLLSKVGGGTVNFISAHDGLTMHDLTLVTSDKHHSWNIGEALRMQQLKNYFTMLLLSSGAAMFVMGDEFARTQQGLDNPFDVDSVVSWVDWTRLDAWRELHDYVHALLRLRRAHPRTDFHFYGAVQADPDIGWESRSLAWSAGGLYVMANAWWQPLQFEVREAGPWEVVLSTSPAASALSGTTITAASRSMIVLRRP